LIIKLKRSKKIHRNKTKLKIIKIITVKFPKLKIIGIKGKNKANSRSNTKKYNAVK
jgi:hypothetical protein